MIPFRNRGTNQGLGFVNMTSEADNELYADTVGSSHGRGKFRIHDNHNGIG